MNPDERDTALAFPDPRSATEDGLLCIGGDLRVSTLLEAYSHGIFPWPQEGYPLLWFSPPRRGVVDFDEVHFSQRFLRETRKTELTFTFDRAFADVVDACATVPRTHETGTWILPEMRRAYIRFFEAGHAHSVEAWRGDRLVGGLYGVYVAGVFSGESMFFRESNASKLCLYRLIAHLRSKGLTWMDTQMVTSLVASIGGKYISRDEFLARLESAKHNRPRILAAGDVL
ncbi:MAG: leucyl/phenylalanyl-tRNA--protein transferase [Bdellovibrionaceae bacterium]|nr:leucyl/phenylalanyl-tRNA--protein transferase [Pseudobdellovibrionaceae bacterium]